MSTVHAAAVQRPAFLPELLTTAEAADYLRLASGTLAVWRCTKRGGPPWAKVGKNVVYRRADLDRYLDSNTVAPAALKVPA